MKEKIKKIEQLLGELKVKNSQELEEVRLKYLSKKGEINKLFDEFRGLSGEVKREVGKPLNELKQKFNTWYNDRKSEQESGGASDGEGEDLSLPVFGETLGGKHPINIVKNEIVDIFKRLGFTLSEGPEIEDDWHNFSALNFPENHPARDMQDTFFIDEEISLRTHTSSVQVRVMEGKKLPIRTISPGRVYRNEAISARANCFFHQVEGLYIDKDVSFADMKHTLFNFVNSFFGQGTEVRFRPSYFPFTEPSAEMDIWIGKDTEEDRRLSKGSGWLEIMGCGMVDPNVLENCGIDPKEYSGYAFGMGIDRVAMIKYGVKDLRDFFYNDLRFLEQFKK
jgi:phenylalanyl-tRNA synthetase alpha chain